MLIVIHHYYFPFFSHAVRVSFVYSSKIQKIAEFPCPLLHFLVSCFIRMKNPVKTYTRIAFLRKYYLLNGTYCQRVDTTDYYLYRFQRNRV